MSVGCSLLVASDLIREPVVPLLIPVFTVRLTLNSLLEICARFLRLSPPRSKSELLRRDDSGSCGSLEGRLSSLDGAAM